MNTPEFQTKLRQVKSLQRRFPDLETHKAWEIVGYVAPPGLWAQEYRGAGGEDPVGQPVVEMEPASHSLSALGAAIVAHEDHA